jgi:peptidoglycan/xylan/chitin deacetylase (PgdA/CDA1 family)
MKKLWLICLLLTAFHVGMISPGAVGKESSPHRAMILDLSARNRSGNTELAALKHCFDIFAIQYSITESIEAASSSPLIFTAGDLRNTTFSPAELRRLYAYVENGGVLVSQVVIGNKLFPLFGIRDVKDSRRRYRISFSEASSDPSLHYLDRPEEKTVLLGNSNIYRETIWTHACSVTEARSLAFTEDGATIFSVNHYGEGTAYCLGVSLADAVLLPHAGNDWEAQRGWINTFEPGSDVYMLIMKSIYEEFTLPAVYLSTIPFGKKTALILTHDVDAQDSFRNMVEFAEIEKRFGVSGTYFITTKYFRDDMDEAYYSEANIEYIRKIREMGADIGSHTVTHSRILEKFPVGDPNVTQKNYGIIRNPTLFGEIKISKELLDRDVPGQKTVAFRSGYLRYPASLIDVLEKSGYLYDSSFSANDIMCNFAYRAFRFRKVGAQESSIVEIPVIFDDSQGLLTPKNMKELVARWLGIINANAGNEAISVLLIHTSETGHKLKAQERLLEETSRQNIWIGNLSRYGDFWSARSRCSWDSSLEGKILTISIRDTHIDGRIVFCVKKNAGITDVRIIDSKGKKVDFTRGDNDGKILLMPDPR